MGQRGSRAGRCLAAAALLTLATAGCMPSEFAYLAETPEKLQDWLEGCHGNNDNWPAKERYCDLAIRSENTTDTEYADALAARGTLYYEQGRYRDAVADLSEAIRFDPNVPQFYENRAYAYEMLDDVGRARADLAAAERLTGDRRYGDVSRDIERDRQARANARRQFVMTYQGFWCGRIQKDSVFYPANEIKIQTFVYEDGAGTAYAVDLPSSKGSFGGVKAGHRDNREAGAIWMGGIAPVNLSVVMWEHDDGGPVVDIVAYAAVTAAMAYAGRNSGGKPNIYRGGTVGGPNPKGSSSDTEFQPGLIDGAVGSVLKSAFGTDNDLVGVAHVRGIDLARLAGRAPVSEHGIRHHIATRHRRGGANCKAYFLVYEADAQG